MNVIDETKKECRRRQRELHHTPEPHAHAALAAENVEWCEAHIKQMAVNERAQIEEYEHEEALWFRPKAESTTIRELHSQTHEATCYRLGQIAPLLVEVPVGGSLAAITLNANPVVAAVIGCGLALFMAGVATAVVSRWVRYGGAEIQPLKQMHRITRALIVVGGAFLLACTAALTVLRSPESSIGASLFWILMAVITLLAPLTSALCGTAADLLSWSRRICRRLTAIRALLRELELLLKASERGLGPAPPAVPVASPTPLPPLPSKTRPAALGMLTLALCAGTGRASDLPVRFYFDNSPSARRADIERILQSLARDLSGYEGEETLAVQVIPFFENPFMATPIVSMTIPGNRSRDCPVVTTELGRLARSYGEAQKRQCDQLRAKAKKDAALRRSTEASKLSAVADRLSELKLPGRCTAVNAMIRRAASEKPNGISLVISDGLNTCASPDLPANFRPENETFFIAVGSAERPIEAAFDDIEARFRRTMPWLKVIEPFRLEVVMNSLVVRTP